MIGRRFIRTFRLGRAWRLWPDKVHTCCRSGREREFAWSFPKPPFAGRCMASVPASISSAYFGACGFLTERRLFDHCSCRAACVGRGEFAMCQCKWLAVVPMNVMPGVGQPSVCLTVAVGVVLTI
eukprot:2412803-Amphidinium_carterae.2